MIADQPVAGSIPTEPPLPAERTLLDGRPWRGLDWLALALVLGVAAAAARWLWKPGLPNQIDLLMSVYRITELQDAWRQGVFFPRWGLGLNYGYGALLFNFYPPLVSYVGLALRGLGLGLLETTKLILTLELMIGAAGVYVYGRRLLGRGQPMPALPAAVAGALFALSPYVLTVLYERGAMAEGLALALLPWLFWAAHTLLESGRRRDVVLTALLVAAVMLAHNITALFAVPGVALYVALLALWQRRANGLRPLWIVAGAFALGLGLSAFYWLPAMAEIGLTRADEYMLSGGIALRNFVVPLLEIVQRTPVHLYAGDTRFAFPLWMFGVGLAGALALLIPRPNGPARFPLVLLAAALGVILLMQANFTVPMWERLPLIRFIQFSWRLYGPASICVALLGGSLFTLGPLRGRAGWAVATAGVVALFALGTANLRPEKLPFWYAVDEAGINRMDLWERGRAGFPLFSDYAPATQRLVSKGIPLGRDPNEHSELPPVAAPQTLTLLERGPQSYVLQADAAAPWTLRLHNLYFSGWQVRVDGASVPTRADGVIGIVGADIPAGAHRIEAAFGDSPVRRAGNLITMVSLGVLAAVAVGLRRWWQSALLAAGVALLAWLLVTYGGRALKSTLAPAPYRADFANGVSLVGWHLPAGPVCAGGSVPLELDFFAATTPAEEKKLFVHVTTPDDSAKVAQFDTLPFDGFTPMTRWEAGELVPHSQTLAFDAATPPGDYKLVFGLYDPMTGANVPVMAGPDTLPGDRLRLGDIQIAACKP